MVTEKIHLILALVLPQITRQFLHITLSYLFNINYTLLKRIIQDSWLINKAVKL